MIKFKFDKKWLEISQNRKLEEQNEFLADSLKLYAERPITYSWLYISLSLYVILFFWFGFNMYARLGMLAILTHLLLNIVVFNSTYKKFIKRWYK